MAREMSLEEHAAKARAGLRAIGLSDSIHYAPDRNGRADALYKRLNDAGDWPRDVGLRADGTMVAIGNTMSVFEPGEAIPACCYCPAESVAMRLNRESRFKEPVCEQCECDLDRADKIQARIDAEADRGDYLYDRMKDEGY